MRTAYSSYGVMPSLSARWRPLKRGQKINIYQRVRMMKKRREMKVNKREIKRNKREMKRNKTRMQPEL